MPENYHAMSESRGHKGSKLLRIIMAVLIVAVLFAASLSLLPNTTSEIPSIPVHAGISYTTHANISIIGNSQFNNTNFPSNGVVSGNGTVSNPYIIEGWDINMSSADGIYIQNTDAHFIIRDCYIHGNGMGGNGIYLITVRNGIINNHTCSDNYNGILLLWSNNNTVSNNTCSNNAMGGLVLWSSDNNTVSNNTCSNNARIGIYLYVSCDNNTVTRNTCSNNEHGIVLDQSRDNTLINNDCLNNSLGGLYLVYSNNNTISNSTCGWNLGYGIYLTYSGNNMIHGNTFVDNNGAVSIYDINHVQAYEEGINSRWNSSGYGNYWSDWKTPDNVAPFGIVDSPYNISGVTGAKDYYPLSFSPNDKIDPTTTASLSGTAGTNGWFRSTVTVSLSAIDVGGEVNTTFYRIGTSGGWLNYTSSFTLSVEGSSTIQFYSRDNASNNETVRSVIVKIDKTPPTGTIVVQGGATFANAYYGALSLTASDNLSGVEQFRCSNDGVTWGSWESWQNLSDSMSWNLQIGDGLKTIFFQIMDNASNTATYNDTIILDTIPPTLTFGVASGVKFTGSSATINWSATDVNGIVSYEYSLDGGTFVSCGLTTHIELIDLAAGSHNLTMRAIDSAGNDIEQTIQFTVNTGTSDAGISGDLMLYGGIAVTIILAIIAAIIIVMRKNQKKR